VTTSISSCSATYINLTRLPYVLSSLHPFLFSKYKKILETTTHGWFVEQLSKNEAAYYHVSSPSPLDYEKYQKAEYQSLIIVCPCLRLSGLKSDKKNRIFTKRAPGLLRSPSTFLFNPSRLEKMPKALYWRLMSAAGWAGILRRRYVLF
jgi:hypothetical protein